MQKNKPLATYCLLGVNVALYFLSYVFLPGGNLLEQTFPLFFPENPAFQPWQFVTSMFMHGSTTHLFMNMFGLFSFGVVLESIWGAKRFLIFYFTVGIGAGIIYTGISYMEYNANFQALLTAGLSPEQITEALSVNTLSQLERTMQVFLSTALEVMDPETFIEFWQTYNIRMVGASGAIYGILTAFGILFPDAKLSLIFLPIPVAAKYFIPAILLLDLFSGVTGFSIFGGNIAHFAHIGGAIIGFLLMLLWRKRGKDSQLVVQA